MHNIQYHVVLCPVESGKGAFQTKLTSYQGQRSGATWRADIAHEGAVVDTETFTKRATPADEQVACTARELFQGRQPFLTRVEQRPR